MRKKDALRLNVLSYNIHKGFGPWGRAFRLEDIREAIRASGADLVLLQEVTGENRRHEEEVGGWPETPQFEYLADETWSHFAYGRNAAYTDGHHGNAILSKFPIRSWGNVDLSNHRLERRGLLWAEIEVPGVEQTLLAATVHLDLSEWGRTRQVMRVSEFLREKAAGPGPVILGGDFNDWRERLTEVLERELGFRETFLKLKGRHARTFPSLLPFLALDRLYYRGLEAREAGCLDGGVWRRLSDHVPLLGGFDWTS